MNLLQKKKKKRGSTLMHPHVFSVDEVCDRGLQRQLFPHEKCNDKFISQSIVKVCLITDPT